MDHSDYDDAYLRGILGSVRTIAIVGASPKAERASHRVMGYLQGRGYRTVPVNPGQAGQTILGETVYASLADIPEPVDMVDVFRNSEAAGGVVDEALALSPLPAAIWMQLDVVDAAAAGRAEAAGVKVVMDRCPAIEIPRLAASAA